MRGRWMLFLFLRKGSMGLMLPQGQAYGWSGKSPHLRFAVLLFRSYFPPKPCVAPRPTTSVLLEKRNQHTPIFGRIKKRQFDLSGNRKVRVSDDFNIEFRLFRQDIVSDDTGDQVGDKIVDTAMSRVLYLTDIFEHIIDRFDQGSLSQ